MNLSKLREYFCNGLIISGIFLSSASSGAALANLINDEPGDGWKPAQSLTSNILQVKRGYRCDYYVETKYNWPCESYPPHLQDRHLYADPFLPLSDDFRKGSSEIFGPGLEMILGLGISVAGLRLKREA